ncbi:hypothetical protein QV08_11575 [Gallibacterium salpingitidis]|uniref:Lipoprotein n=1 Tax=Gallibacterium salpingitidis TaxID=505341 RepID=A0AB36E1J3_9PAST|nr:hypothetical protein [Gallibacterium salpingitidis]OBX05897.1 hypothetical protein QV08_11575 [Gallibacterium salpingitidis]OBX09421.1 hypothetical protein QV09_08375 [Gallibacterium salpingitidis]
MRRFLVFPIIFLLSGCIYSFSDNCIRPLIATVSNDCEKNKGKIFPIIARFQKPESIGKTDSQQRWKDATNCGSKYGDEELTYIENKGLYKSFESCMFNKGYIRFHPAECGYQNPKWDKGKCNL